MPLTEYTADVAMDVRAYGSITIKAETAQAALDSLTAKYVAENFSPHGSGDDDFSWQYPSDIVITAMVVTETDKTVEDAELEHDVADGEWIMPDVTDHVIKDLKDRISYLTLINDALNQENKSLNETINTMTAHIRVDAN